VPIDHWFRGELNSFVRDKLLSRRALERGYFDNRYVRRLINEHMAGRKQHQYLLWNLLMLELWHETFIDAQRNRPSWAAWQESQARPNP